MKYNHLNIEKKWQEYWDKNQTFKTDYFSSKPKQYILDMYPYPSGAGLHIGHLEGYTATDIMARMKRMQGYEVLHPIGWDAFGLPAEQYAIKTNNSPKDFTAKNIDNFRRQIKEAGFSYDFSKEIDTTDPKFYKTTQWIFSKLFEKGLAEYKEVEVNWCSDLGTVLANEEILTIDGKMVSERGNYPVIKKPMSQWVLKITKYADKLLKGLSDLEWPDSVKSLQKNWIGKSIGVEINFNVNNSKEVVKVFTTKPETIYGVTFLTLAPENKQVLKIISDDQKDTVLKYIDNTNKKTEIQRKQNQKPNGVFTGSYAINPINGKKIQIWIGDYVLNNYATGSVMACPGGDERDLSFAKHYKLDIMNIYDENKLFINSGFINKTNNEEANKLMINYIKKNKIGLINTYYKLKDWLFSRQRYWGEPFPLIHMEDGEIILDPNLPVILPRLENFSPTKDGTQPLTKVIDWVNIKINNKNGKREVNTMPQWAGSCWYYIAYLLKEENGYLDIESKKAQDILNKWLPVDLYIGGQEHAVLHLLYARFWHLFLYDIGIVKSKEPFYKLFNQGMILGEDGTKMSKSIGNVINPDDIIQEHGADTIRIIEMFLGALEDDKNWKNDSVLASRKWLDRVYRLINEKKDIIVDRNDKKLDFEYNNMVKNATNHMESLKFNLAISDMMIFVNSCYQSKEIYKSYLEGFIKIFSTFAPHLGEELWNILDNKKTIAYESWPKYSESKLVISNVTIVVQVNGKVRGKLEISRNIEKKEIIKLAKKLDNIKIHIENKIIIKEIFIPNKLISFVVK